MHIHENLEMLRTKNKESQQDIANLLNTTQQQYWKYEKGKQELPIRHLITLAKHYNVSTDELLGLKEIRVTITQEEKELLKQYNKLNDKNKGRILERISIMIAERGSE